LTAVARISAAVNVAAVFHSQQKRGQCICTREALQGVRGRAAQQMVCSAINSSCSHQRIFTVAVNATVFSR
jgi:hypothetical protein